MNAKWVEGNSKLLKTSRGKYRVVGFGIPADHTFKHNGESINTCPAALACRAVCYAKQGTYNFPNVIEARQHNLKLSLRKGFVKAIINDLQSLTVASKERRKPYNVVRLHDSGDFYSQEYLDNWAHIARQFPDVIFYAYTKSLHLSFKHIPSNLRITRSQGGRHDKLINIGLPHSRIFSTHYARRKAGYRDGNLSDIPAIEGVTNIGLVYHGGRDLTPAQKKFFS